ncbi:MAG: hypothetical protein ACKVP3_10005 [Hyphomicrobiaceae bacterium]
MTRTAAIVTMVFVAIASSAQAQQGEIYCGISDSNVELKLLTKVQPGGGQAAIPGSLSGSLDIHHQKVPRERRNLSLDKRAFAQFWNYANELKLRLFIEQDDGRTDLVVDTKLRPGTDGDYAGNFRLETSDGVRVTGRAECSRP